jgi:hypothetical protein
LDLVNECSEESVLDPRNAGVQKVNDLVPHLFKIDRGDVEWLGILLGGHGKFLAVSCD